MGVILEFADIVDVQELLSIAREYAQHWWLIVVLIFIAGFVVSVFCSGGVPVPVGLPRHFIHQRWRLSSSLSAVRWVVWVLIFCPDT